MYILFGQLEFFHSFSDTCNQVTWNDP